MNKRVYLIGIGKVGSSLAFELKDIGFKIDFISDRNTDLLSKISELIIPVSSSLKIEKNFIEGSDIIFISTQDTAIADVINEIAEFKIDLRGKIFIITSGAYSTDLFPAEVFNKDSVLSMHPIQTFDKISYSNGHLLDNIYFGIEGGSKAVVISKQIIEKLNSKYIEVPKDKKYLYHSACVISSNFLVTLLNISSEVMGSMGIEKSRTFEIFRPIIENTLKNISTDGLVRSLTGPFDRNDIETISNHLNAINNELPSLIPFYTLLGMETVKVAFKKESLNLKNVTEILDLMNEYIVNEYKVTMKKIN
ncbi:MAG TPA: DUF2520 domain-containing protein [Ignavibacteria bacterium]|mgnify:CR=1 FL=1|nr:DUF2520 domain-containing protein [Ignavibacteria bacterium]